MDVRQLTLPVSQPSAAVVPREQFLGMPKRGLAFLLANVMFWQPIWAQADGIAVSGPGTSLVHAGNSVPIVNIAAPNASGLSHNQFQDYNVGANRVILNNATVRTQPTQLGGIIQGNPNLNGTAAQIILNEVNGGRPSQLNGYTEVAGQSARLIVANPYGISCNGCGFIITPRVTLTTGKPVLNGAGGLDHYQVDGGSVSIDGVGLNANNVDVQLSAASLANASGTVQNQGALALTLTGDIDNRMGRLIAQNNDLLLNAGNVDNRGGVLSSLTGAVSAWLSGMLNNGQGGIVQGQSLDLTAQGGIDNTTGRLAAQTGDALIHTSSFNNTTGGLYATGGINLTGSSLDNSNGQIAGDQIDLALSGALSNRLGIVESGSTLNVTAASVDNQSDKLRALGTSGQTRFQIGGLFDNQNGTLESANTDLILATGNLLNANGTVLHVGTGTFDIDSRQAMAAGGSLVTRGALSLIGNGLTNRSVIQAGRLTLNLNNFSQTADGQLLASDSLIGTGVNWNNDGLIASDGSIHLTLGGAYSGNGRLSAAGDLTLNSDQVSLSNTASIAAGGTTTLNVGGPLINYGRLTSSGDLILNADSLANYGTLGSAQSLTVTTPSLLNDHGLIFSGGDMSLRVSDFTNSYADVYSLGKLSIDRDGNGGWANSIINSSSSIQSDGAMSLAASTIQNVRALLTVNNAGIYTTQAYELTCIEGVNAGDCSGKQNHAWEIVTREKLEVTAASAASSITAGGNLSLTGGNLLNASSTIATSGNLTAVLNNLTNSGVETSDTEYTRQFMSERTNNASNLYNAAAGITDQYWYQSAHYDPNNLGGIDAAIANFIAMTERELTEFNTTTKLSTGDQSYAAVIQAAGAVNITTQNNFDNSTVRAGYTYVGSGTKTNTDTAGSAYSTPVSLNQQLSPDLAQQQVNPTTLPGFSLPTGQNGLFRLSEQDSSTGSTGPQSWTLGGANLLIGQHQDAGTSVARVRGVPTSSGGSHPQKYLIETNPVLTDLKQFMSSDYLLGALGYDPDQSARRLGDGFYEQTLIWQAIVARTGQRFLEGETSDEAQFRYLMDNAIASKDALNLSVGVSLTVEQVAALKDLHQESHEKSSSDLAWQSAKGKGNIDETLRRSELTANGQTVINAVNGLHIDFKQIDQKSVSETIDTMVQADPSLARLKDAEARGDVNWQQVKEIHDSFDYSSSGLGAGAMLAIIIVVAALTAGAASALAASAGSAVGAGGIMAAATVGTAAGLGNIIATSVLTAMAGNTTVSSINNKGNLGSTFADTFSSESMKNYIIAGVTAGLAAGVFNGWTGTETSAGIPLTDSTSGALANTGKVTVPAPGGLSSLEAISQFAANQALQNTTSALLNIALGRDSSQGDALQNSLVNAFAAYGFNLVGDT